MKYYTTVSENIKKLIESGNFKADGHIELYFSKDMANLYSHPLDKYYVAVEVPRDISNGLTLISISGQLFEVYNKTFSEVEG